MKFYNVVHTVSNGTSKMMRLPPVFQEIVIDNVRHMDWNSKYHTGHAQEDLPIIKQWNYHRSLSKNCLYTFTSNQHRISLHISPPDGIVIIRIVALFRLFLPLKTWKRVNLKLLQQFTHHDKKNRPSAFQEMRINNMRRGSEIQIWVSSNYEAATNPSAKIVCTHLRRINIGYHSISVRPTELSS